MSRAGLCLLLGATVAACLVRRADTCDATHPCVSPSRPYCDLASFQCLPAPAGSDGGVDLGASGGNGSLPAADLSPGCAQSSQCSADRPICDQQQCRGCAGPGDDDACASRGAGTPRCDSATQQCVACRADTQAQDCAATTPICDQQQCRGCRSHAECASGVCIRDGAGAGSCAAAAAVVLVDNGGLASAACQAARPLRDGNSAASAYCDVTEALAEATPRPYLRLAGSAVPYSALALTDRSLTLIGPGRAATPTARLFGLGSAALALTVSAGATVVVDGVELGGDASSKTSKGASCTNNGASSGNAVLVVRNASLHDSSSVGLDSDGCSVTLDSSLVTANAGGGVRCTASAYVLTNDFIVANGRGSGAGVVLDSGSSGVIAFATIAKNSVSAGVGGVDCGSGAAKTIAHSIVWGNDASGGTQLGPQCQLADVVTGSSDARGTTLDPTFVSSSDFHLKLDDPANVACCVDRSASASAPNADHDVDGHARPRGAGWDDGAHEVQ